MQEQRDPGVSDLLDGVQLGGGKIGLIHIDIHGARRQAPCQHRPQPRWNRPRNAQTAQFGLGGAPIVSCPAQQPRPKTGRAPADTPLQTRQNTRDPILIQQHIAQPRARQPKTWLGRVAQRLEIGQANPVHPGRAPAVDTQRPRQLEQARGGITCRNGRFGAIARHLQS